MNEVLSISNFKCFQHSEILLRRLSVFVGANGMGKSTVIQTLLLLRQCLESKTEKILLNGPFSLSLGSYDSILSHGAGSDKISFSLSRDSIQIFSVSLVGSEQDESFSLMKKNFSVYENYNLGIVNKCFYFLSAERTGPRIMQRITEQEYLNVGVFGEYTAQVLSQRFLKVDIKRCFPDEKSIYLLNQVNAWLNYILPGNSVTVEANYKLQVAQIRLRNIISDDFVEATNLGFGISYCLPIIVTGLIAENSSCIVIENPEAHLHPAAQTAMGKFLAMLAMSGLYVVVETHSDHVLDGIQIYVAKHRQLKDFIIINNFGLDENRKLTVTPISYNEKIEYTEWPNGFMDASSINYSEFLRVKSDD